MANKEEVILDLSVDQGSMIQELERTKKSIIQLKQEQQELTKAYKAGNLTVEEYASESVRLEAILKKQQATYNNTQKSVTGVKTKMDELIGSNNKLADSVSKSTENIRIGGVSVAELGTKLTALANPVTATVAIVSALGAAYARSSIGAKDLEFASNQLGFATTILTDRFASLFSSVEDGEGIMSKISGAIIAKVAGLDVALSAKLASGAREELEQIGRDRLLVEADIQDKLGENAELLTDIANKETKIEDKRAKALQIQDNLADIAKARLELLNREEDQERIIGATTANKEALEQKLNEIQNKRSRVQKEETKQTEKIEKQVNAIISAENQSLEIEKQKNIEIQKRIQAQDEAADIELQNREVSFNDDPLKTKEFDPQEQFEKDKEIIDETLGLTKSAEDEKRAELLRTNALKDELQEEDRRRFQESAQMMEDNFNTLAGLFSQGSEARKLFALAGIGADTASAIASLTAMSEANPANAVTFGGAGIAQYAAGIIRILANIVAAKEFLGGSFAGGADFVTSKPTMIMVGDNPGNRERVTVQPLSGRGKSTYNKKAGLASFAGGGSMTFDPASSMASANVNQALATSNAIKRLPRPVVSVKEFTKVAHAVEVKQDISTQ